MISIYCICGMGFGTSLMLKMTIDDILGKHKIRADVSAWDLGSAKGVKADLFVCSQDMKNNVEGLTGKMAFIKDITNEKEVEDTLLKTLKDMGKI